MVSTAVRCSVAGLERGFDECAQTDGRVADVGGAVRAGWVCSEFGGEALVAGTEALVAGGELFDVVVGVVEVCGGGAVAGLVLMEVSPVEAPADRPELVNGGLGHGGLTLGVVAVAPCGVELVADSAKLELGVTERHGA